MCSVNFWHQQDYNSLFRGSIGYVTSYCKWPSIIYLPSGTRGVVAQSPEPEAHDKSD